MIQQKVRSELNALNTTKTTGLDGIDAIFINIAVHISYSITKLCNLSILNGVFPLFWKRLELYHKNDAINKIINFRPLPILPVLSKVLERLL